MAFSRRQLVVLLLLFFFLAVSTSAVPISRSLNVVKKQVYANIHSQVKDDEGRMMMTLSDYPGTGANHNHDPKPPGRV
ncbi:hypothetical protein ACS0TY_031109 [Phlomoides rotata]